MPKEKTVKELYYELGLTPPESIAHMTEEELREKLTPIHNHRWSQQGTTLSCSCELGTHTTQIPTSHILTGTDNKGMPQLQRITV
jgi:hypothetical protein